MPLNQYGRKREPLAMSPGFTMIELLMVVAVAAALAALAAPSFRNFMAETRSRSTMSQLVADLNYARLEAVKRNSRVVFCPQVNKASNPCSGTDWSAGWVVCYDKSPVDGQCDATADTDPNPMKIGNPLDSNLALTVKAGGNNVGAIVFTATGTSTNTASVILELTGSNATTRTGTVAPAGSVTSK